VRLTAGKAEPTRELLHKTLRHFLARAKSGSYPLLVDSIREVISRLLYHLSQSFLFCKKTSVFATYYQLPTSGAITLIGQLLARKRLRLLCGEGYTFPRFQTSCRAFLLHWRTVLPYCKTSAANSMAGRNKHTRYSPIEIGMNKIAIPPSNELPGPIPRVWNRDFACSWHQLQR
jgi:hypothetical protein